MKRFLILIFLLSIIIPVNAEKPIISKICEKETLKHFGLDDIRFTEIDKLSNESDLFLNLSNEDKPIGILVLSSAKGRYDMFDYMIIYNLELKIELIKILVYRSDYGSEITAKRWLSQFYNRPEDSLIYGSDIQAISGATFSASSLTTNINRINKILSDNKED